MPIKPRPRKLKCKKCGYAKIIAPKSDVLNISDFMYECPKCGGELKSAALNPLDMLLAPFANIKFSKIKW